MKGIVCDLLWEAATMNQNNSLEIYTAPAFLKISKDFDIDRSDNDVLIICDELVFSACVFDNDGFIIKANGINSNSIIKIIFKTTNDFLNASEKIIFLRKDEGGLFSLSSLINQFIIEGKSIKVHCIEL